MQNIRETNKTELLEFIKQLDAYLDEETILVAIGGTALTLLNIKSSTRDIDLIVPEKHSLEVLKSLFIKLNFKELAINRWLTNEGIIIDLYPEDYVINVKLLDSSIEKSELIRRFDNITLKALNLYDICITKIDRGDKRDYDDIKLVLEKSKVNLKMLIRRYLLTMEDSDSEAPKYKLLEFTGFLGKLGYKIDKEDNERIRKWQSR